MPPDTIRRRAMCGNLSGRASVGSFGGLRSSSAADQGPSLCRPALMCLDEAVPPKFRTDRSARVPGLGDPARAHSAAGVILGRESRPDGELATRFMAFCKRCLHPEDRHAPLAHITSASSILQPGPDLITVRSARHTPVPGTGRSHAPVRAGCHPQVPT